MPQILFVAVVLGMALLPACSLSTESEPPPTTARVVIQGSAPNSLILVVSNNYYEQIIGDNTQIAAVLVTADTVSVDDFPFEHTFALNSRGAALARLIQPDSAEATVTMQVYLDGREEYNQSATLAQVASLEYRYLHRF